jgi:hypothetical protein
MSLGNFEVFFHPPQDYDEHDIHRNGGACLGLEFCGRGHKRSDGVTYRRDVCVCDRVRVTVLETRQIRNVLEFFGTEAPALYFPGVVYRDWGITWD